ncbi:MAG: nickel pincer cofactor biosynthesis protein LarC [Deltaproteobacteria bacterium]|nr:nickel pincer cofactor biosynthesis protein LarC [Deltaproteobacteria bacterium]
MTVAALLDLGVPLRVVEEALATLPVEGYAIETKERTAQAIAATGFDVTIQGDQPERSYAVIDAMLQTATLDPATGKLARAIFRRLGEAEAAAHRIPLEDVHFHEVGAVDAIVDVVSAAACLTYLGAEVVVSPLPMGRGFVQARHGVLPLPAPATVHCLRGAPTVGVELDAELVTPTGAAIVASAARRFERWPSMVPEHVGFGAGHRELADRPNLLRVVLGRADEQQPALESGAGTHVVIESNVDDMTGELAGHALGALLDAGAVDAWATPITMKKGRPALTMAALVPRASMDRVVEAFFAETTTIGLRCHAVSRVERNREIVEVSTPYGKLPVKVSRSDHGPPQVKPEFDRCVAAARDHGVPVRVVLQAALAAYDDETG